jgi:hypothetical protein
MKKEIEKLLEKNNKTEEKIKSFSELLNSLKDADEKKKILWKEIYENAISDRERASILFTEAYKSMSGAATDHVSLGSTMSKYLERMCKSNEQILRLAELIAKAEQAEAKVDPNELFAQISE